MTNKYGIQLQKKRYVHYDVYEESIWKDKNLRKKLTGKSYYEKA